MKESVKLANYKHPASLYHAMITIIFPYIRQIMPCYPTTRVVSGGNEVNISTTKAVIQTQVGKRIIPELLRMIKHTIFNLRFVSFTRFLMQ